MALPLMPKATAVWLIEKTALSFTQIAEFCGMHPLEVQAIADGEVAAGIVGYDPVANMQVTAEDITRCEADPEARLKLLPPTLPPPKRGRGARYTPVAKRNDRPERHQRHFRDRIFRPVGGRDHHPIARLHSGGGEAAGQRGTRARERPPAQLPPAAGPERPQHRPLGPVAGAIEHHHGQVGPVRQVRHGVSRTPRPLTGRRGRLCLPRS